MKYIKGFLLVLALLMVLPIVSSQDYFGTIYFKQTSDLTVWEVFGSHDEIACCYEMYFIPEIAEKIITFVAVPPLDLFEGYNMSYRILTNPNSTFYGCGQAIGSYPLGQMNETFNGLLGYLYTTEPINLYLEDCDPDDQYQAVYWWDGTIPNYPRLTQSWVEFYTPIPSNICEFQHSKVSMSMGVGL